MTPALLGYCREFFNYNHTPRTEYNPNPFVIEFHDHPQGEYLPSRSKPNLDLPPQVK